MTGSFGLIFEVKLHWFYCNSFSNTVGTLLQRKAVYKNNYSTDKLLITKEKKLFCEKFLNPGFLSCFVRCHVDKRDKKAKWCLISLDFI
jgi:hypothetical protein